MNNQIDTQNELTIHFKTLAQLLNVDEETQAKILLKMVFDIGKKKQFTKEEISILINTIIQAQV